MKLKNLVSLNILCFLAYLNLLFTFCSLLMYEAFYEIIETILDKKIYTLSLDDICEVYTIFLFIGYFLIATAIAEYFIRKKHNKENNNSSSKTVLKKIFNFTYFVLFWMGLALEFLFIFLYTLLNILV